MPDVGVYDLENQPTTFDFVTWCALATSMGAKSVRFFNANKIQDWKYPVSVATDRLRNILIPVAELYGLEWSIGDYCDGFTVGHHIGHATMYHKRHGLKLLDLCGNSDGHVTVTIRDSIRNKFRDSSRREWDKAVSWLENNGERVVVIEDGESAGTVMSVENRVRLYSSAKMNLGVANGPMCLCIFSRMPYLIFKMIPGGHEDTEYAAQLVIGGFPLGSQPSFKTEKQEIVWQDDTFDNIVRNYDRVIERRHALAD